MVAEQENLQSLMYRLREWRWDEALQALQGDVLFVTDSDIKAALEHAFGHFKGKIVSPDVAGEHIDGTIKKVIVFCKSGEQALVKQLRQQHPAVEVVSATYDLGRVSVGGGGYFEWQPAKPLPAGKDPILILATPGSDAEYLGEFLRQNGLGNPKEFLNRTVAEIARLQTDFSVLRYLAGVYSKHGEDRLELIVYTDVLESLLNNTDFSLDKFLWLLGKSQTRVIYFSRRDKSMQAALLSQLHGELGRSFWATGHLAQPRIDDPYPSDTDLDDWLGGILHGECIVEPKLEKLKKFKYLTLEELVESPAEVMEAVAVYLNREVANEPNLVEYSRPYKKRPNLLKAAADYRQALMDRLNITVDEHGAFVSPTNFWGVKKD